MDSHNVYPINNTSHPDILIVGSGALATLFGALFANASVNVHFYGNWKDAISSINKRGLSLRYSNGKTIVTHAKASNNITDFLGIKIVLILVKSWQTKNIAHQIHKILPDDGVCISLQNGFNNYETLANILGEHRVIRGITTYGATLIAPAHVNFGGNGIVTLENHARIGEFIKLLQIAKIQYMVSDNIEAAFWEKIMINATINPLTTIWRVKNGELLDIPNSKKIIKSILLEIMQIAKELQVDICLDIDKQYIRIIDVANRTSQNISSMLQDIERCFPTEIDVLNGEIVSLGKQYHLQTPVNDAIVAIIKSLIKLNCTN